MFKITDAHFAGQMLVWFQWSVIFEKICHFGPKKMFCHFYRPFHTFISYSLHFWIKLNSTKLIWMCPGGQNPSQFTALEIKEYVILMLFPLKFIIFDHIWSLWEFFVSFRILTVSEKIWILKFLKIYHVIWCKYDIGQLRTFNLFALKIAFLRTFLFNFSTF